MREQGIDMDNRIYIDEETGEDIIHPFVDCNIRHSIDSMTINDAETGEPEVNIDNTIRGHRRVPFQSFSSMETNGCKYTLSSRQPNKKKSTNVNHLDDVIKNIKSESQNIPKEVKEKSSKKRHYITELEPVPAGASFGQINPICLFLPAIIYFRWFLALLMLFEVILHVWAHHKNKALKDASVYFRSPFHDISAEFCALCQNETCMNRVGKLHQIWMHKFLRQCNYMKRVVT